MALVFASLWLVPPLMAGQRPVDYSGLLLMVGLLSCIAALVYSTRVTVALSVGVVVWSYLTLFARYPGSTVSSKSNQTYVLEFELLPYAIALLLSFAAAKSANPSIRKISIRISAMVAAWALLTSTFRVLSVNPYVTDMWFMGVWIESALTTGGILVASLMVFLSSNRKMESSRQA